MVDEYIGYQVFERFVLKCAAAKTGFKLFESPSVAKG